MTSQSLTLAVSKRDENVVLAVHGELDLDGARLWTESFSDACTSAAQRVTVDLAGVTFIDSTGLRMLLLAGEAAEGFGLHMELANVPVNVTRLFEICGLVGHFSFDEVGEALQPDVLAVSP